MHEKIIGFDADFYKPLLLSTLLKKAWGDFMPLDNLHYFDEPVFFKDSEFFKRRIQNQAVILKKLTPILVDAVYCIFSYTYQHLSKRKYNALNLSALPVIEDIFLEILIQFEKIAFYKNSLCVLNECVLILHKLSQLGGARSILQGNATHLMTSLKFFIKYLECDEK